MKIFFRYLFTRLLHTFLIVLGASTIIWVMADLYGNMDDFLDHKVSLLLVLQFYSLQIPKMLVLVLPAAMLFSTLFTLLSLNRRSELVALQSGGMAPLWMFSPFFLFAFIWTGVLAYDMSGPAARAEVTRERLLRLAKGMPAKRDTYLNLPYIDNANHLIWFFQSLDTANGRAKGVAIVQQDAQRNDMVQYVARTGRWTGEFWRLSEGQEIIYGANDETLEQKYFQNLDLPDMNTPPQQLALLLSEPEDLSVSQLSQYIATSTQTPTQLARYRTEWWYRIVYPSSVVILILFALMQGARSNRRSALAGVGVAIVVLIAFMMANSVFMAIGRSDRLPPLIAASATDVIFGLIGLQLLAVTNGWWWQLHELWKHWYASIAPDGPDEEPGKGLPSS